MLSSTTNCFAGSVRPLHICCSKVSCSAIRVGSEQERVISSRVNILHSPECVTCATALVSIADTVEQSLHSVTAISARLVPGKIGQCRGALVMRNDVLLLPATLVAAVSRPVMRNILTRDQSKDKHCNYVQKILHALTGAVTLESRRCIHIARYGSVVTG